jgi:Conserved in the green lineage and diatoms 27
MHGKRGELALALTTALFVSHRTVCTTHAFLVNDPSMSSSTVPASVIVGSTRCFRRSRSKGGTLRARGEVAFGRRYGEDDDDDDDDLDDLDEQWRRSSSQVLPETSFGSEAVPEGQRPVNEYLDMLRSPLFDWALSDARLQTRLALLYLAFFFAVCWPIAGATFTSDGYVVQKLVASHVGAAGVVLALLVRLYTGWNYVGDRLRSTTIEYEETGWFDGDVETKTLSEQKRDKFLYQSEVRPVVDRLKALTMGGAAIFAASVVGCNAALTAKPVFNQYDPEILEQLRYDEKLAEKAAYESTGKPTYCDSRYYRAVAGGAPGCN